MSRIILILYIISLPSLYSQGSETFENSNLSNSYSDSSYIGDNSVQWSYIESRNEGDYGIDGKGIMLRSKSSESKIYSETVSGGISEFSCKLKKGFTGQGNRQVELYVNGSLIATSISFDDTDIHNFIVSGINLTGNVVIEIRNNTNKQVVVDNIWWSGIEYDGPEMIITGNGNEILDGDTSPDIQDGTDFGEVYYQNDASLTHMYTISNTGNQNLELSGIPKVEITGANASDFSVIQSPVSPITSGDSTTFTITFNPGDIGLRTATISIANNDPNENPYTFKIQGWGVKYHPCDTTLDTSLAFQSFESGSDNWNYTPSPDPYNIDNDVWNIVSSLGTNPNDITGGSDGNDFWGIRDLDNQNGGGNTYHTLNFTPIDISNAKNVVLSFDYYSHGFETTDEIRYKVEFDNDDTWGNGISLDKNTDSWTTMTINIPDSKSWVRLQLKAKQEGEDDWAGFDNIRLTGDLIHTTVWDGTSWDNGNPDSTKKAVIQADYNTDDDGGSIEACACKIAQGATFTVTPQHYLQLESDLEVQGGLVVEHEGSFVQKNDLAVNNIAGTVIIHKTTTGYTEYDYTYWGTPVSNTTVEDVFNTYSTLSQGSTTNSDDFSPPDRIYVHDTSKFDDSDSDTFDDEQDNWVVTTGNMIPGTGYIVMGAGSDIPFDPDDISTGLKQSVKFRGTPNNGIISVPVVLDEYNTDTGGSNNYNNNKNYIANPYASAIDIEKFYNKNSSLLDGTFYFWTHYTSISSGTPGPYAYNFTNDDYSVYSIGSGGVASASGGSAPSRYVASCQGFVATVSTAGTLEFNNDMRVNNENDHFLQSEQVYNRFWLNMKGQNGDFRQILIGFYDEATDGYDPAFDSPRFENGNNTDFFSIIEGDPRHFAIQGLHTFHDSKTVKLGLEIIDPGSYDIELDHGEGVFAQGQKIYLFDKYTQSVQELTGGSYHFNTNVGEWIEDRLVLYFNTDFQISNSSELTGRFFIYQNQDMLHISSENFDNIDKVEIFTLLGQQTGSFQGTGPQMEIPIGAFRPGQILLLKINSTDGKSVNRKVIIK